MRRIASAACGDAGDARMLVQADALAHRMAQQRTQLVQALGQEAQERRQRQLRSAWPGGITTSPSCIWQVGHQVSTRPPALPSRSTVR